MKANCAECREEKNIRARGLCYPCYAVPEVRVAHGMTGCGNRGYNPDGNKRECVGCGTEAPYRHGPKLQAEGWHVHVLTLFRSDGTKRNTELHCPDCFSRYGVPEEREYLTPEQLRVGRKPQTGWTPPRVRSSIGIPFEGGGLGELEAATRPAAFERLGPSSPRRTSRAAG